MKRKKKLKAAAVVIMMLILVQMMCIGAFASSVSSTVTFTNEQEDSPDLFITKTVVNAVEGYEADPDTEFTFVLKWDLDGDGVLSFAANEKYTVYNEDGSEVIKYDSTGSAVSYKTSSTGRFTLKAGQTAKFEYVGTGVEYLVTEEESDGFTQTLPAGGSAEGTVDDTGTTVYFENTYIPTVTTEEEVDVPLTIQKSISGPYGSSVDSGQEFTFTVVLDGEAYANQQYAIYDTATGTKTGNGTTDSNGSFAITGGQYATFEDIPVGEDYMITEGTVTGWTAESGTTQVGGTSYPATYVIFTNKEDGERITLTKVDADDHTETLEGVTFGIYEDGECTSLVEEMVTDADGYAESSLLAYGTYYVKEMETLEGYELNEEVYEVTLDGTAEAVPLTASGTIENEKLANCAIKIIKYGNDGKVLEGVTFTLYDSEGNTIGEAETDGNGEVLFDGLIAGDYTFTETSTVSGHTLMRDQVHVTVPLVLSQAEVEEGNVDTTEAKMKDGNYYFYSVTYEVTDSATFVVPQAGMDKQILWACVIGMAAVCAGFAVYAKRKKGAEHVR